MWCWQLALHGLGARDRGADVDGVVRRRGWLQMRRLAFYAGEMKHTPQHTHTHTHAHTHTHPPLPLSARSCSGLHKKPSKIAKFHLQFVENRLEFQSKSYLARRDLVDARRPGGLGCRGTRSAQVCAVLVVRGVRVQQRGVVCGASGLCRSLVDLGQRLRRQRPRQPQPDVQRSVLVIAESRVQLLFEVLRRVLKDTVPSV